MLVHILGGKNNLECSYRDSKIHSLPCKIHADCDAPVSKYFEPYVTSQEDVLKASFRGFPLLGMKINFPEHYKGIILHESIRPETEDEERRFYVVNNFNSITYWNWDKSPTKNDLFVQALDWLDIAEALHSPIME
ncbi:ribonuclease H2 subunit C isoform X2 [Agrilus planipennis]|uniref:Ribonuclease H2 subunit C isoform X2 n=1 Tax=Agrilus planipennis TaxID=224129 RepID=A0A7F5R4L8_AGRPL|nr:ribonuclease H2 subunit C isoform X2 [Agrilus planipennis]